MVICKIQCNTNFENNNIKLYILGYKISCDKRIFDTEFNITFKHKSYYDLLLITGCGKPKLILNPTQLGDS